MNHLTPAAHDNLDGFTDDLDDAEISDRSPVDYHSAALRFDAHLLGLGSLPLERDIEMMSERVRIDSFGIDVGGDESMEPCDIDFVRYAEQFDRVDDDGFRLANEAQVDAWDSYVDRGNSSMDRRYDRRKKNDNPGPTQWSLARIGE